MASSNRRKKQNRAKAAAKHAEARRRRAATARIHAVQARLSRIYDPETSAAELAVLLGEHYQGVPVAGWLASALLREGSSLARLQDAAELILPSQDAPALTALTFAAAVAGAAGDAGEEQRLIAQALAAADEAADPDVRLEVVDFISTSGHAAEAVELLEPRLKEAPDDDFASDLYGVAIERAYATARADETAARERAAVHRFADRTGLVALRDAVGAFLDGTELGEVVRAQVTEELSEADDLDWSPEGRVAFAKLAEELAWLTVNPGQDEDKTPDNTGDLLADDDPAGVPLLAFAADPSTPSALAARALAWHEHIHYGLWRIEDPVPAPGLRCTDIVSGTERYVEFPAGAAAGLPRWTVWLGGIVPVDGVWRSTGAGVRLSPAEADAVAGSIDEAALATLQALAGEPEVPPTPIPFGHAEPHGVYADDQEPVSAEMTGMMGKVAGAMITGIVADVHRYRATPPVIANTDGDPMCLISATIAVEEGTAGQVGRASRFRSRHRRAGPGHLVGRADPRRPARGDDGRGHGAVAGRGTQGCRGVRRSATLGAGRAAGPWPRDHRRSELPAAAHPPPRRTPQGRRQPGGYLGEADRPGAGLRLAGRAARSPGRRRGRGRRLGEVLA